MSSRRIEDSDLARDEIRCLFFCHDDLIESIYQISTPAVHDIFRTMSKEASKQTDSRESLSALLEDGLSKSADWNRLVIREVTRSWSKLSRVLIMLVKKICKVKALIMKKNGLIPDADVQLTLEFSSIMHSMIVFSAVAVIEDMESFLNGNGSQASTEIIMRKHQAIEKAVVHLVRDALNEKMLENQPDDSEYTMRMKPASGTFPSNFASAHASHDDDNNTSQSVSVLRYSVPQIEAAVPEKTKDDFKFDTNAIQTSVDEEDVDISDMLDEDFPLDEDDTKQKADEINITESTPHAPQTIDLSTDAQQKDLDLKYSPIVEPEQRTQELHQQQQPRQPRYYEHQSRYQTNNISRDLAKILLKEM